MEIALRLVLLTPAKHFCVVMERFLPDLQESAAWKYIVIKKARTSDSMIVVRRS